MTIETNRIRRVAVLATFLFTGIGVHAQDASRTAITAKVDAIVADALVGGRAAGMSVAVVSNGDTLVRKGYGQVDLEWKLATPARAVYEIGSVTKQSKAAAILQLVQQGKIGLDESLTTYFTSGYSILKRD